MQEVKRLVGYEKTATDEALEAYCPALSFTQRIIGFCGCAAFGCMLDFFSLLMVSQLEEPDMMRKFAITYTLGNLCIILGMTFLAGPATQCKSMCAEHRALATAVYLGSLALTVFIAVAGRGREGVWMLCILCMVVQFLAACWCAVRPLAPAGVVGCVCGVL